MTSLCRCAALSAGMLVLTAATVTAQDRYKMTTPIPRSITTPDRVETRIGTLNFFDGVPTAEAAAKVYDQIDFMRGRNCFFAAVGKWKTHGSNSAEAGL
jgi:hypothetical protein